MGLFGKKKDAKINGEYFGSHPALKGHYSRLHLVASEAGVAIHKGKMLGMEKEPLVTLPWSKITGFDTDTATNESQGSRVSATRVVTTGVIGLAAKKKQTKIDSKTLSVLHTTTGDIELESKVKDDGFSSTGTSAAQLNVAVLERQNHAFRVFVADHINSARS